MNTNKKPYTVIPHLEKVPLLKFDNFIQQFWDTNSKIAHWKKCTLSPRYWHKSIGQY